MRKDLVDQEKGQVRMTVQVPLDNMKRVTVRELDYFYHHIPYSAFSLGLALPSQYGKYLVSGGLQMEENNRFDGFFKPPCLTFLTIAVFQHQRYYLVTTGVPTLTGSTVSLITILRHFLVKKTASSISWD